MSNEYNNPVIKMIQKIKDAFISEFGKDRFYASYNTRNPIDYYNYIDKYNLYDGEEPLYHLKPTIVGWWVARLVYQDIKYLEFAKMIEPLEMAQYIFDVLFRYGTNTEMYEADFWDRYDGLYRECRSIVINVRQNKIMLLPFKKFFNLNEREESKLEVIQEKMAKANCIEFTDKLDGSMQSARYINEQFFMAGSQSVNPTISWRLADGYRKLTPEIKALLKASPDFTCIFEYISLDDAHVVKYDKSQEGLYLIGMRNVLTGEELAYHKVIECAKLYGIPTTTLFNKTLDEVLNELDNKTSDKAEGFVINIDGYKVKVKYNDYVQVHKILSKLASINVVIENVANGTFDDFYAKLPAIHQPRILKQAQYIMKYTELIREEVMELYGEAMEYANAHLEGSSQVKEFMIYVDTSKKSRNIKGFAKSVYFGKPYNPLCNMYGTQKQYKKYNEIIKYMEDKGYARV